MNDTTDLAALRARLDGRLEDLAEHLIGPPNAETLRAREWRWGTRGSRALVVRGPKRGCYCCHEDGTAGGILDMIMHCRDCGIGDAIRFAKDWLGDCTIAALTADQIAHRDAQRAQAEADATARQASRIAFAQHVWDEGSPIDGCAAHLYLGSTRGIPRPAGGWGSVRFHPGRRALMASATTPDGTVQAVHLIHLTPEAQKISNAEREQRGLPSVKVSHGVIKGAAVRLPGDATQPLAVAEGLETGISIWSATGMETWVALGGLENIQPPAGRRVIAAIDDDPAESPRAAATKRLLARWRADGIEVLCATPWAEPRGDKSDMNDTIKEGGAEAVRARIHAAQAVPIEPAPPAEETAAQTPDRPATDHRTRQLCKLALGLVRMAMPHSEVARRVLLVNRAWPAPMPEWRIRKIIAWAIETASKDKRR